MKKVSLSKYQTDLIRTIYIVETVTLGEINDYVGGNINDKLLNYSPFILFIFTDEELDYLKLRLNSISNSRKLEIARITKEPIGKIDKTIKELIEIFK